MGVLVGLDADIYIAANPSISIGGSPEACTNTDSGIWKEFKTNTHRYWDKRQTLTVQTSADGATGWATAPAHTFRYTGGVISFPVASPNHFVRVSAGYYFNVTQLGDCNSWQLDMKANSVDTTVFQSSAWGTKTGTSKQASGKITGFRVDDRLSDELSNLIAFSLYVDKSVGARWECLGTITGVTPKSSVNGVVEQDASFDTDGNVYYYATSALP
jgi:hypothetical protein